jgi:hypothetical protein
VIVMVLGKSSVSERRAAEEGILYVRPQIAEGNTFYLILIGLRPLWLRGKDNGMGVGESKGADPKIVINVDNRAPLEFTYLTIS